MTKHVSPKEVLEHHMTEAHTNSTELRSLLITKLKSDRVASPTEIMRIVQRYGDNVERAIDIASKLLLNETRNKHIKIDNVLSTPKIDIVEFNSTVVVSNNLLKMMSSGVYRLAYASSPMYIGQSRKNTLKRIMEANERNIPIDGIMVELMPPELVLEREKFLIETLRPMYNITHNMRDELD